MGAELNAREVGGGEGLYLSGRSCAWQGEGPTLNPQHPVQASRVAGERKTSRLVKRLAETDP